MKLFEMIKGLAPHRRPGFELAGMDPRMLADIGLNPVTARDIPFHSPFEVSNDRV